MHLLSGLTSMFRNAFLDRLLWDSRILQIVVVAGPTTASYSPNTERERHPRTSSSTFCTDCCHCLQDKSRIWPSFVADCSLHMSSCIIYFQFSINCPTFTLCDLRTLRNVDCAHFEMASMASVRVPDIFAVKRGSTTRGLH